MRHVSLPAVLACLVLCALPIASPSTRAEDRPSASEPHCSCPEASKPSRPKFAELGGVQRLNEYDEIAALRSIQVALTSVDDGTAFAWKHVNGHLSGIVRPTASFRNASGSICRHLVVLLTTGYKTRTLEGVACRASNRRWVLEG